MQTISSQLGIPQLETFAPASQLVSADAIGMELELEGFTHSSTDVLARHIHPSWRVTQDGSLRNGGIELITNGGLGGARLFEAFQRLSTGLERVNYDASFRCSTHMHVNMLDFTINQVVKFILAYTACEPVLFEFCGAYRKSSNFCTPISESMPFHKKLISQMIDGCIRARTPTRYAVKYTALNVLPLFPSDRGPALGTVEFRGGRPLTTLDDMVLQANLLLSIKQFVRDHNGTDDEFMATLSNGVMNTVYANGVAAGISVPVEELECANAHAWCLLKSYQNGIAEAARVAEAQRRVVTEENPQTLVFNTARDTFDEEWTAPIPVPAPGFNNNARLTVEEIEQNAFTRDTFPEFFRYLRYIDTDVVASTESYFFNVMGRGNRSRLTQQDYFRIFVSWCNHYPSGQSLARRVYTACLSGRTSRMLPGWCAGVDFDTRIIPTDFNYQHRLIPEHFNRLCSIWGTANSNSLVYTHLFMDKVKIKRGGTLFERAVNSGFNIISEKVERAINSDGYMRASDLFVIFRILNVISSDYIRVNHQLKYNRVAAAMSILADNNLQVPFLRDGKIRFMAASKSAGLAEAGMRTQRQSTMPVAQVQGISVY